MATHDTQIILYISLWENPDLKTEKYFEKLQATGLDLNFQGHLSRRTSEIENLLVLHEMTPFHTIIYVIIFWLLTCPVGQVSL